MVVRAAGRSADGVARFGARPFSGDAGVFAERSVVAAGEGFGPRRVVVGDAAGRRGGFGVMPVVAW